MIPKAEYFLRCDFNSAAVAENLGHEVFEGMSRCSEATAAAPILASAGLSAKATLDVGF